MKFRIPLIAAAGSVAAFLLVGWLSLSTADFGMVHDDGIYTVTGRSLAATGEYRIISLPGEPYQQKYPIVFPAMLAAVWKVAGEFPANIVWMKLVSLLAGAVFLLLTFGMLRAVGASGWTAATITGVCAFLPATGEAANMVMSELPYGAASIGALWLLERSARETPPSGSGVAVGVMAGIAYQIRTVGVSLVIAMIVVLACRRRWRALAGGILGAGLAVWVCGWWQGPPSKVPLVYEYYVNYGDWSLRIARDMGWRFLAVVPLKNLVVGLVAAVRTALPEWYDISRSALLQIGAMAATLLFWSALILCLVRRWREAWAIYLLLYFAVILAWPFFAVPRFFVPVLPLMLFAAAEGIRQVRPPARVLRIAAVFCGALFVASAGAGGYVRLRDANREPSLRRYEWIRKNTAPGDVIACVLDPNCFLYTGRKSVSMAALADMAPYYGPRGKIQLRSEKVAEMIRTANAAYVMVEPFPGAKPLAELTREATRRLRQDNPGRLEEVWRDEAEDAVIYRVRKGESGGEATRPAPGPGR